MKRNYVKYTSGAILTGLILFTSCQSTREVQANYEVAQIEGTRIVWINLGCSSRRKGCRPA